MPPNLCSSLTGEEYQSRQAQLRGKAKRHLSRITYPPPATQLRRDYALGDFASTLTVCRVCGPWTSGVSLTRRE